jgi:hypothetical protein
MCMPLKDRAVFNLAGTLTMTWLTIWMERTCLCEEAGHAIIETFVLKISAPVDLLCWRRVMMRRIYSCSDFLIMGAFSSGEEEAGWGTIENLGRAK